MTQLVPSPRRRIEGLIRIYQFNRRFYRWAGLVLLGGGLALLSLKTLSVFPNWVFAGGCFAWILALWWVLGSLLVSHWIYDQSDLYRFGWLQKNIWENKPPRDATIVHAGYDEVSSLLEKFFPNTKWTALDIHDPKIMPEPSIAMARKRYPPSGKQVRIAYNDWGNHAASYILFPLTAHELRHSDQRIDLFRQAKQTGGKIVLLEHLRDLPNFVAFGPGFLHFHSRKSWEHDIEKSGLQIEKTFRVTPFLRCYVLSPDH